jgi:hypothetical protein
MITKDSSMRCDVLVFMAKPIVYDNEKCGLGPLIGNTGIKIEHGYTCNLSKPFCNKDGACVSNPTSYNWTSNSGFHNKCIKDNTCPK